MINLSVIRIRIDAVPVAQPRQRHALIQGRPRNYTPTKDPVNVFKAVCQMEAAKFGFEAISEPMIVDFEFIMPRPKKLDGKKFSAGRIPFGRKPDRDNLLKSTQDALNGILWTDDAVIYDGRVSKFYAAKNESPHVVISIWP
jgi:Holliday junction resolvase RusA-like endonuclease